eukprot:694257-Prymnesium_polylepis.1
MRRTDPQEPLPAGARGGHAGQHAHAPRLAPRPHRTTARSPRHTCRPHRRTGPPSTPPVVDTPTLEPASRHRRGR